MAFQNGFTLENHTIAALERHHNFRLDANPNWDHKYKVDFIVYSIPGFRPRPTGVQITQRPEAIEKMSQFLQAQMASNAIVDRALYIEVAPSVPLDEGGTELVALALRQYQADRAILNSRVLGVRIHDDMSYEFFDIAEAIKAKAKTANVAEVKAPPQPKAIGKGLLPEPQFDTQELAKALMGDKKAGTGVQGVLTSYRPARGFGMAVSHNGEPFFVHIYNVVDPELKERLQRYSGEAPVNVELPISFIDGGRTKSDARYNEAKQIAAMR
ncbi:MAG TPA: hypothetical protein VHY48_12780 [Acidobacteriaceae bacterium]|jgi:hypothetical protein|nr:hypothetical protein [Acidobacteriaceae bacterium]